MRTTSSSPGFYGGQPQTRRPAIACSACGRPMAPGPGHVQSGTCFPCIAQRLIAIPRGRLLIRAGAVQVDPTKVRAYGRGPSRRAKKALLRRARLTAIARQSKVGQLTRVRQADRLRAIEARPAARKEVA